MKIVLIRHMHLATLDSSTCVFEENSKRSTNSRQQAEGSFILGSHSMSRQIASFFTDFADLAVILPLIASVAAVLWLSGWRRGALVWFSGTGATLAVMVILKLTFRACGEEMFNGTIASPSGHTAVAGAVYGSILAFMSSRLGGRDTSRFVVILVVIAAVGISRVLLKAHNVPEVCVGGAIGFIAAEAMLLVAGDPPNDQLLTFSYWPLLALPLLLHGMHFGAERSINGLAVYAWPFSLCR